MIVGKREALLSFEVDSWQNGGNRNIEDRTVRRVLSYNGGARSETMPKLIPVADALSKPFWDAVNQRRLVLQHCAACDRLQYPPQQACQVCGSAGSLAWKEVEGRGHIASYIVIEDGR